MRPWRWLEALLQDLRFAVRLLMHSPGFTVAAVGCLSIGIGVTTAMYSNMRSTVFGGLPGVREPEELVRLQSPMPYGNWKEFRSRGNQFSALAPFLGPAPFELARDTEEPERLWGHLVTPNYFDTLGVRALAGRVFGPEEEQARAARVVVISERLWRQRFGLSTSAVGKTVRINGQSVEVIGVAPKGFVGASPMLAAADIWIPTTASPTLAPELHRLTDRRTRFDFIGRLQQGRTVAQAEAALEPLARRLEQVHNDPEKDRREPRVRLIPGGRLFPVRDEDLPKVVALPAILVGLVLLMACGNVANMLVARSAARRREIAVRLSIGGGRGRIVRQLLTESLVLAALGGAGGLWLARWQTNYFESLRSAMPGYIYLEYKLDWHALVFSVLATFGAAVLFGLAPALNATSEDIVSGLKPATPRLGGGRMFSLRNILVFHQVAASMVLVLITGFIVVGVSRSTSADLGFDYRHLYVLGVDPVRDGYEPKRAAEFFGQLPQRLSAVPGVMSVSLAQTLPVALSGSESLVSAKAELAGGPIGLGAIRSDRAGPGFFETMGIPVLRGRGFDRHDVAKASRVVVVNETMARQVWPGRDPVGSTLDFQGTAHEVVGVAGDIRSAMPLGPKLSAVYLPLDPSDFAVPTREGVTVVVRVQPGFDAASRLRGEIGRIDRNLTIFNVRRMEDVVGQIYQLASLVTGVYGAMGVFALILATVGLASVTAYSVARRTHEIGIRVALGATQGDVLRLVLRESTVIVAVGGAVGLAIALAALRGMGSILGRCHRQPVPAVPIHCCWSAFPPC
ncbi:MAG: ABC transporter permease [Candidatus Solibacter sp.]